MCGLFVDYDVEVDDFTDEQNALYQVISDASLVGEDGFDLTDEQVSVAVRLIKSFQKLGVEALWGHEVELLDKLEGNS